MDRKKRHTIYDMYHNLVNNGQRLAVYDSDVTALEAAHAKQAESIKEKTKSCLSNSYWNSDGFVFEKFNLVFARISINQLYLVST